tara:strand:+ start:70 stop:1032 length:963 start_codon:yes stop_codon:yes gene_type:complete
MKLIDIIGRVIIERASDEERVDVEEPKDKERPFDVPDDETIFDFPSEADRERFCMEFVGRDDVPERCVDVVSRAREERPRDEERPREDRPRDEERPIEEPRVSEPSREEPRVSEPSREEPVSTSQEFKPKKVKEPRKTKTRKAPPERKKTKVSSQPQTTPKKDVTVTPQYNSDGDIKDITQARPQKYVEQVINKLEKQLTTQPPEIQQRLTQLNITPKTMANLVPLSNESGVLMTKMELDGLNLPLMMVLYNNTPQLYKSMETNKPLKSNDVKPITGNINYMDFWKWNKDIYDNWGGWLKSNVVGNFPNISKSNFPSLAF